MREFSAGRPVRRVEDARFIQGLGRYTDDIVLPRQAHLFVLRSPYAAARIGALRTEAARAMPGVLAVLTGEDLVREGLGTAPSRVKRQRRDGLPNFEPPFHALAVGRVRHVGAPVAAVVAESLAAAKEAAEAIEVEYQPLPSVTQTAEAARPGAPPVWDEVPDNVCFFYEIGDKAAVEAAFARADHVTTLDFTVSRVSANPMEPRNAIGFFDRRDGRYTLWGGTQEPHTVRRELATFIFSLPETQFRVVSPDVGGGFGMKEGIFPEFVLVLWASRLVGRPVRWQSERGEGLASDHHARDNVSRVELALDRDGKFLALRHTSTANLGAFLSAHGNHSSTNNLGGLAGTYTTPHIHAAVTGIFSNTNPTAPYRGAGRPEASYAIERVIDVAAADLGIDRVELRRGNLIPPEAMPYRTGLVYTYDSGEFGKNLDDALVISAWRDFPARRAASKARGLLRGIGLASVIEIAGGPAALPNEEHAELRFDPGGNATLLLGTHNHGQGHETVFRQVLGDALGLDPARVRVVYGDTDEIFFGKGTFGSRSMSAAGTALLEASQKVIAKGKLIAAHLLETAAVDIEFSEGRFIVAGTDRAITIEEVAKAAFTSARLPRGMEPGLGGAATVVPAGPTFPNGCHVCEIEIDPQTGVTRVVGYWVVDDVGRQLNPMLVAGQIHGGVAQGLGQILLEEVVYEPESGQLLSGSFMDYGMPRADDVPNFVTARNEVPAKTNPLGVKGAGEAGCVGALPAIMNAIVDALGVRQFDMPATPERVWRAINSTKL